MKVYFTKQNTQGTLESDIDGIDININNNTIRIRATGILIVPKNKEEIRIDMDLTESTKKKNK